MHLDAHFRVGDQPLLGNALGVRFDAGELGVIGQAHVGGGARRVGNDVRALAGAQQRPGDGRPLAGVAERAELYDLMGELDGRVAPFLRLRARAPRGP